MNSFIINVTTIAVADDKNNVPPRRRPNLERQRGPRGQNILDDYFIERTIFPARDFHRRYRMSRNLFNHIKITLCNHDTFWHQRRDAAGVLGLFHEPKDASCYAYVSIWVMCISMW